MSTNQDAVLKTEGALARLREAYAKAAREIENKRSALTLASAPLSKSQRALVAAKYLALQDEFFPRYQRSTTPEMVYFVQRADVGHVKIGVSRTVERRVKALQTASATDLVLLASVPGSKNLERDLHRRLAHRRISREWFIDCPELRETIAGLMANSGAR